MKKFILLIVVVAISVLSAEGVGSVFYEHYSGVIDESGDAVVIGDDVEMLGGYVGSLTINGTLTVRAGEVARGVPVSTYIEDGTLNLCGGTLNDVGISLSSGGILNIYGYGFNSYYDDVANLHITGFLEDDHPFSVFVWEYQINENPGEVNLIPEPAALSLMGLGGFGFLRRRKSAQCVGKKAGERAKKNSNIEHSTFNIELPTSNGETGFGGGADRFFIFSCPFVSFVVKALSPGRIPSVCGRGFAGRCRGCWRLARGCPG